MRPYRPNFTANVLYYRKNSCLTFVTMLKLERCVCPDGVRCFSRFVPSSLTCEGELGDVDQDTCCLNSNYGYQTTQDGLCHSCGCANSFLLMKLDLCEKCNVFGFYS